jgi:hypothetical protein
MRPYLEKTITKRACGVTQVIGPEFKLQYEKKQGGKAELGEIYKSPSNCCPLPSSP